MTTAVLAGGVGAAKFLAGLVLAVEPASVTAIVNVADDTILHGLHISPDLDTVTYTLAGAVNPETGWGLAGESWQAMEQLARLGGDPWFRLGDRDLGTHLYRTGRLVDGATLSEVTAEIATGMGLACRLLPATDDSLRTMVTLASGEEVDFQTYFVARQHADEVASIRFDGWPAAGAAPGVLDAIRTAEVVVIAPSNPVVSIGPLLAVDGIEGAVVEARDRVVAISPIVAGAALKGPADRLLQQLGHEPTVVGVARLYAPLCSTLVIDEADADLAGAVETEGVRCVVTDTIMRSPEVSAALARTVLAAGAAGAGDRAPEA
ncbi:MAG: 2-phospho-L-lactate transferase [Acidimicrobiia bacterium]|nr:2-phospho-L-lactate transferase [Acidimicrobiia bacterium]